MATVIYALIALLAIAAPVAAQSTRVDAIAEQQAEKSKSLATEGPSDAEQVIRRVLLSPLLSGGVGLYPWFGSIYSGTGIAAGAGYLKKFANASSFNFHTGVAVNRSTVVRGVFVAPELWRGRMQFETSAQSLDAHNVAFYGFGQHSDRTRREAFDYTPKDVGAAVTIKPVRVVSFAGGYTFVNFDTARRAPRFFGSEAIGLDEELNFHVTRAAIDIDTRAAAAYSTRGGHYRASFERNIEAKRLPFSFTSQEYEAAQLVPVLREQFVFAVRALVTLTNPDEGSEVPVMMSPYLGSGDTLRGFATRRFTDRNRALLTGEYRWRPSRYLDMALFVDAGQVTRDRRDFDINEFDVAWGIGARMHGSNFNALRLEVARGREGFRIIFAGSQPF